MKVAILIPHWKTGNMTAYCIAQILRFSGNHQVDIHVIDNNSGDGSTEFLAPFAKHITIWPYPKDTLQSHGIAFDWVIPSLNTEYFITLESDSYPTKEGWLDYYENLALRGIDCAGSLFELSGGEYLHPCGAMYKKSNWLEAKRCCDETPYSYFPNMAMKDGFACHLMLHKKLEDFVLLQPDDYMELARGYLPYSKELALSKMEYYRPVRGPFHNGMGRSEESIKTYRLRSILSETPRLLLQDGDTRMIRRIGFEPGQWFSYWHFATGKNVVFIPTEIKWIHEAIQQEYTLMENGLKHIWGVSSHLEATGEIANTKRKFVEELYESLPNNLKI